MALGLGTSLISCGDDDSSSNEASSETAAAPGAGDGDGSSGDGESQSSVPAGPGVTVAPGADPAETGFAPVTVEGDALPELPDDGDDPAVGMRAPSLSGMNYSQEPVAFTPGQSPTLLVFVAHWCPHCNNEIPTMLEWRDDGDIPEGLDIIGVSTGVNPGYPNFPPGEWLAEKQWAWPVIADDETYAAGRAFGLSGFPFLVLVGADGNVVARTSGEHSADELSEFVNAIQT
jgi:hypothetical protein